MIRTRTGSSARQRTERRRVPPDGVQATTVDRCERCAAAALDIADAAAAGRSDQLTLLRHVLLIADEMKAHAGWLRRMLVSELVEQGLTQDRVATVLGVTRQRVTTLVRETATSSRTSPVTRLPKLAEPRADGSLPTVSWTEDVLLDALFERCTHGLALVDRTGRFLRVNPRLAGLLQFDAAELVGSDLRSYEPENGAPRPLRNHVALRSETLTAGARRTVWKRKDGGLVELRVRAWPVRPPRERRLAGYAVEAWPDDGSA